MIEEGSGDESVDPLKISKYARDTFQTIKETMETKEIYASTSLARRSLFQTIVVGYREELDDVLANHSTNLRWILGNTSDDSDLDSDLASEEEEDDGIESTMKTEKSETNSLHPALSSASPEQGGPHEDPIWENTWLPKLCLLAMESLNPQYLDDPVFVTEKGYIGKDFTKSSRS
jgi:hypothetical protein